MADNEKTEKKQVQAVAKPSNQEVPAEEKKTATKKAPAPKEIGSKDMAKASPLPAEKTKAEQPSKTAPVKVSEKAVPVKPAEKKDTVPKATPKVPAKKPAPPKAAVAKPVHKKPARPLIPKGMDIGIDVELPKKDCDDQFCPFHGNLPVRGQILEGIVVSDRMQKSVVVKREFMRMNKKYERLEKRSGKYLAHNPPCLEAKSGDRVRIMECRPLSKTISYVVIENRGV